VVPVKCGNDLNNRLYKFSTIGGPPTAVPGSSTPAVTQLTITQYK